jgi:hypothetical protein
MTGSISLLTPLRFVVAEPSRRAKSGHTILPERHERPSEPAIVSDAPWWASKEYREIKARELSPLDKLRNGTAYTGGRRVANIIFGTSTIAAIIGAVIWLAGFGNGEDKIGIAALSAGSFLFGWFSWELGYAVFDIADCAVKRNSN